MRLRRLQAVLMGSVTASALCLAGGQAEAGCSTVVTTLDCSAVVTAPITATNPAIDTISVHDLTVGSDLTSPLDTNAISITGTGNVAVSGNAGAFGITTTGTGIGINAVTSAGDASANWTGNVNSAAGGIVVSGTTLGEVIYSGNINSTGTAISADASAGAVTVTTTGNLTSTAGGGISATAAGDENGVTIGVDGDVSSGANFSAVFASAAANDANIGITVAAGSHVVGGSAAGAVGVRMSGGGANTLTNSGTIRALSGFAIAGDTGNDAVINNGLVIGNVDLGVGTNAFTNGITGELRPGVILNVGTGNSVQSSGVLSPGGANVVVHTGIAGSLVQTPVTGQYRVDVNTASAASDRISATGAVALQGFVVPNLVNRSLITKQLLIATSDTSMNAIGLSVADTAAYDYSLLTVGNNLFLNIRLINIDALVAAQLTPNQQATVNYLDTLLITPGLSPNLVAFLDTIGGLPTEAEIVAALDRLNPEHYLAAAATTVQSVHQFTNSLMSCPSPEDPSVVHKEGQCYWAQLKGRTSDWDTTLHNVGGSEDAGGVTGGVQSFIAQDLILGGAVSYEHASIDTDNAARSDGDRIGGGLVLKSLFGDTIVAGAVFGGVGSFDTKRFLTPDVTATSNEDVDFAGGSVRLSHTFDNGDWYWKPILDGTATYLSYGGFQESGAGDANLHVQNENQWVLEFDAALEVGSIVPIQPGLFARPYLRFGVSALSDSDYSLTSSFVGAPAGVGTFTVVSSYDDLLGDISAGLDVFASSGLSVNLNYDGRFGDNTNIHAASAKLRVTF